MRLKRLELAGFKSFAKPIKLEFNDAISAIVGPNGSGKSNVVEGIRWVLGEQSLKNLRGKKGEDFIFNGSQTAPKLGKATVSLVFENTDKSFKIDYEELIITRKVFRDSTNEYFINGSKVRLKDIIEILSQAGLGASHHHIISQGEADRILSSSPKERKQMIEDALGLKIYQIKRAESERKLLKTEENIKQVEALQKEIQPHLRFLKTQAEKFELAASFRDELKRLYFSYLTKEESYLSGEFEKLKKEKKEPQENLEKTKKSFESFQKGIDGKKRNENNDNILAELEKKALQFGVDASSFEREMGRYEGMIESYKMREKEEEGKTVSKNLVRLFLQKIKEYVALAQLEKITGEIEVFSKEINAGEERKDLSALTELERRQKEISAKLENVRAGEKKVLDEISALKLKLKEENKELNQLKQNLFEAERESGRLRDILRSFELEEERLKIRKEELETERQEAERAVGLGLLEKNGEMKSDWTREKREKIKKEISRLKIKLEDSGGVSSETLDEYKEVRKRDEFFSKELSDLKEAALSLAKIMEELSSKLDNDFRAGIVKINKELSRLFQLTFGGGGAELKVVSLKRLETEAEAEESEIEGDGKESSKTEEKGVDMKVDLPRKRIGTMAMLSGGERALTSIALLFAMSYVNPPPFLVLDETDAALDESNSVKYGRLLIELSKKIQLIVVTHNRETMKQAGLLYGVTMGADSISKLISVKLNDL